MWGGRDGASKRMRCRDLPFFDSLLVQIKLLGLESGLGRMRSACWVDLFLKDPNHPPTRLKVLAGLGLVTFNLPS